MIHQECDPFSTTIALPYTADAVAAESDHVAVQCGAEHHVWPTGYFARLAQLLPSMFPAERGRTHARFTLICPIWVVIDLAEGTACSLSGDMIVA